MLTHRHILFGSYFLFFLLIITLGVCFHHVQADMGLMHDMSWLTCFMSPALLNQLVLFHNQVNEQNPVLHFLLPYIIMFTLIFIALVIFLILWVLFVRISKIIRSRSKQRIEGRIQDLVLDYLYDQDESALNQLRRFPPVYVTEQIYLLATHLIGPKATALNRLVEELDLKRFILRKSRSVFWYNRLRYLPISSALQITEAKESAEKSINCYMPLVRNAAEMALINLDDSKSLDFLYTFNRSMSDWHQLNIYHILLRYSIPPPDFSRFLHVRNSTVISFALHMIQLFNQRELSLIFYGFLFHQYQEIRRYAICAIREFGLTDAVPILIKRFKEEDIHLQLEIIKTLAAFETHEALEFLSRLMGKSNMMIRMEVLTHLDSETRTDFVHKIQKYSDINRLMEHVIDFRN